MRRDIVRFLRLHKPSRVICQSPDRSWTPSYILQMYHRDHLIAGRATLEAIFPASQNPWDFPELMQEGLKPHKVSEVYIAGAPVQNFAVDITLVMDIKMQALHAGPALRKGLGHRQLDTCGPVLPFEGLSC